MTADKPKIIEELEGLIQQAAVERSHYYVTSVCEKACIAIGMLIKERDDALVWRDACSNAVEESNKRFAMFERLLAAERARSAKLVDALNRISEMKWTSADRTFLTAWSQVAMAALSEYSKEDEK